jgi:hypothetical protein
VPGVAESPQRGLVTARDLRAGGQRGPDRQRRVSADPPGQLECPVQGAARRGDPVHEAQRSRAVGSEVVAGQQQLPADVRRQRADYPERAPEVGHQPSLDLGKAEPGVGGGHHQVAAEHQFQPAAQSEPLDRGDERLSPVPLDEAGDAAAGRRRARALGEISAGTEEPRSAGEHAAPQLRVVRQFIHRRVEARGDLGVDRVPLLLALDRDDENAAVALPADRHQRGPDMHAGIVT